MIKRPFNAFLTALILGFNAFAESPYDMLPVPKYAWTVDINGTETRAFDAYHGETVVIDITFKSGMIYTGLTLYWQEAGMGNDYWSTAVPVEGGKHRAVFTPDMDTGAKLYNCFVGIPGVNYRAAFQLRFRNSPGAEPAELPLPVKTLDFAKVYVENAPYYSREEADAVISSSAAHIARGVVSRDYIMGLGITDRTLSKDGEPADSKAAGDAFRAAVVAANDASGQAAFAVMASENHRSDTNNPHAVTAAQIGAVEKNGRETIVVNNAYGLEIKVSDAMMRIGYESLSRHNLSYGHNYYYDLPDNSGVLALTSDPAPGLTAAAEKALLESEKFEAAVRRVAPEATPEEGGDWGGYGSAAAAVAALVAAVAALNGRTKNVIRYNPETGNIEYED